MTAALAHRPSLTIGGKARPGSDAVAVRDPSTEAVVGWAPTCTEEDLDAAMAAASSAGPSWAADEPGRRQQMRAAAEVITCAADELALLLTAEQGKPLREAHIEVRSLASTLRWYAALDVPAETLRDDNEVYAEVVRTALGCVVAIAPWNYPLLLAAKSFVPALRAGNTVVLKPSPHTPLTTLRMGELLRDVFPPGVLNVLSGGDDLGARMTAHPTPRGIVFTGSVATGMKVAATAAVDLKRVLLELGGNDAAILLDDVDLDRVGTEVFWGAFRNNGQTCWAIKRLYVPKSRYDEVIDRLVDQAQAVVVGDGREPDVQLGPVNNRAQVERIEGLVADAVNRGARLMTGGRRPSPGWFYEPAIISDAGAGMALVDEEQFGPALPVIAYETPEDAVRAANATNFGLRGSVWSSDPDRACALAAELECGTAYVNTHSGSGPDLPAPAHKWSGIGVSKGAWSLDEMSNLQLRYRARA